MTKLFITSEFDNLLRDLYSLGRDSQQSINFRCSKQIRMHAYTYVRKYICTFACMHAGMYELYIYMCKYLLHIYEVCISFSPI